MRYWLPRVKEKSKGNKDIRYKEKSLLSVLKQSIHLRNNLKDTSHLQIS